MKKKWIKSTGFEAFNLPSDIVEKIVKAARTKRVFGKGKFCYVPMDILIPGIGRKSIVVCLVDQAVREPNLKAEPGDVVFNLREEWNEKENPL